MPIGVDATCEHASEAAVDRAVIRVSRLRFLSAGRRSGSRTCRARAAQLVPANHPCGTARSR